MIEPITDLENRLSKVTENSPEKVDLLNELAWQLRIQRTETAIEIANQAFELAKKINYPRGLAFGKRNLALAAYFNNDYPKALTLLDEALEWFEANDERYGAGTIYNILGMANWSFGDFHKGIDYTLRSLEIAREFDDSVAEGWILSALGGYHADMKEYDEAQKYYEASCRIFEALDLPNGIGRCYTGLGNVLTAEGKYEQAMTLYQKSLELHSVDGNDLGTSRSLNDIGLLYQKEGDYDRALEYLHKSLKKRSEMGYSAGESTTLLNIGELYLEIEQPEEAGGYFQRGLKVAEIAMSKPKMVRAYRGLSITSKLLGNFEEALTFHEQFHELEEEVYHEDVNSRIKNMQSAYETQSARKEAEIYRLKNVELKEANTRLEDTIQQLNAAQAQLVQAGKMAALGKLVAGIAHELNTPVGSIHSAADVTTRGVKRISEWAERNRSGADADLEKTLGILEKNNLTILSATERVTQMVNGLKRFSRLDAAEVQKCDINLELDNTLILLNPELEDRIRIQKAYGDVPPFRCNPAELNQVLMNLLLNAIQAIDGQGNITIRTRSTGQKVEIEIEDSGKGISAEKLDSLFEPDFTFGAQRVKMRTGLYNSYSIVEKHGGQIKVKSAPGKGTTFTVLIPVEAAETVADMASRT